MTLCPYESECLPFHACRFGVKKRKEFFCHYNIKPVIKITSHKIVKCLSCGCSGNNSCGYPCISGHRCELNEVLICPCCRQ